jgi:hypothetical protein
LKTLRCGMGGLNGVFCFFVYVFCNYFSKLLIDL